MPTISELLAQYSGYQVPLEDTRTKDIIEPVYCDVCGKLGDAGADHPLPEGWISLFSEDAEDEIEICSLKCLTVLVLSMQPQAEEQQPALPMSDANTENPSSGTR